MKNLSISFYKPKQGFKVRRFNGHIYNGYRITCTLFTVIFLWEK